MHPYRQQMALLSSGSSTSGSEVTRVLEADAPWDINKPSRDSRFGFVRLARLGHGRHGEVCRVRVSEPPGGWQQGGLQPAAETVLRLPQRPRTREGGTPAPEQGSVLCRRYCGFTVVMCNILEPARNQNHDAKLSRCCTEV